MVEIELYKCPKCGHTYEYPEIHAAGCTFWNCPACGVEDGVHVSPAIETMLSKEELAKIESKKNTICSLKIVYGGVGDIPKLKKYKPELNAVGNTELISKLSSCGGIIQEGVTLLEAEVVKIEAESYGLVVEINA